MIQVSFEPGARQRFLIDPAFKIINGKYVGTVPKGIYVVGVEAVDGNLLKASDLRLICQVGAALGQQNFNEEFYNRAREETREVRHGEKAPVVVLPGLNFLSSGVDIVTSVRRKRRRI